MKLLILVEHDSIQIKQTLLNVIAAAKQLTSDIDVLLIGHHCASLAEQLRIMPCISKVKIADHHFYEHQLAENTASVIATIAKDYAYVLAASSTYSKNILPRVAALLDVSMLSDVTAILSADTFIRPMYAGNILATVQTLDEIKIMTIRATSFPKQNAAADAAAVIEMLPIAEENILSSFESHALTESKRPELTAARIVVSGGRGLKSADNFQLLEALADQLGAAIGASRAAVDAGFAPNDYQVGQTGKIVAPDLYIAVGISGAIQHLAGMKESKVVVAINNDPEAPIFQVADYGLVGDLFTILPELQKELTNELNK